MGLVDVLRDRRTAADAVKGDISLRESVPKTIAKGDRFLELRSLDCFDRVRSRLMHGHSPGDVARYILHESGEFDKLTRISTEGSLRDLLVDFKKTLSAAEIVACATPAVVKSAKEEFEKGIDEVKELEKLYILQKDRIEIDYATERKIKKLFKTTGNEIAIAMGILKIMANLKQELGLMRKELGTLEVDHTLKAEFPYKSKVIEEVMRDPASRAKVVGMMRRVLERPDITGEMFRGLSDVREAVEAEAVVIEDKREKVDADK